jgi:Uri superfamily endonuclease
MKGTYLLVMELHNDTSILVGNRGMIHFQKGYYIYVGSALNGLDQRIQRHLRNDKKIHWHIDYLLPPAEILTIFYKENTRREECRIARLFARNFRIIPSFGCSDCACISHLFSGEYEELHKIIVTLGMKPYLVYPNP